MTNWTTERTFPPVASSVRDVRLFVEHALREWGMTSDSCLLVAAELATNAVVHAGTDFTVLVRRKQGGVGIEVTDHDAKSPVGSHRPRTAEDGRGLLIVERLARNWGVRPYQGGKTVWSDVADVVSNGSTASPVAD